MTRAINGEHPAPIGRKPVGGKGVTLLVNGVEYAGWKTATVTRSIETIAGGFELGVSERWGGRDKPWDIVEEDECVVSLYGEPVITGWVDVREPSFGPEEHTLAVNGRGFPGALVDCSALLNDNGSSKAKKKATWEFAGVPLLTLVKRLADVHGITVFLEPASMKLPPPAKKLAIEPGDTMFNVIDRACKLVGVLPISDGWGRVILMRPGSTRTHDALIQGKNLKGGSARYDASERFRTYEVHGQHPGADDWFGPSATGVKAESTDKNVRRASRTLLIRAENALTPTYAKQRAEWEAQIRAARSGVVTVRVQGWRQSNNVLWPINAIAPIKSDILGVDGDMLITQAVYSIDSTGGEVTTLTLKGPKAFQPEPVVTSGNADGLWKELRKGV